VKEGDEVEFFGDHISVEVVAEKLQTIPYEVWCNVAQRVKRVYYTE
jgi:alanine racemase